LRGKISWGKDERRDLKGEKKTAGSEKGEGTRGKRKEKIFQNTFDNNEGKTKGGVKKKGGFKKSRNLRDERKTRFNDAQAGPARAPISNPPFGGKNTDL